MNPSQWKSMFFFFVTFSAVLLLSACGGGSSSSGAASSNSNGAGGTTLVRGNVTSFGGAQAMLIKERPATGIESLVKLITDGVIPAALAQEQIKEGIKVCIEEICTFTDANGNFTLDATGKPAGQYVLTFMYGEQMFSTNIQLQENTILTLHDVSMSTQDGQVYISNIEIVKLEDEPGDEGESIADANEDSTENYAEKVAICHKPGTPAEKTMYLPEPAIEGHLRHGDKMGKCNDTDPTVADSGTGE